MKKRIFNILLVLALIIGTLSSCTNDTGENSEEGNQDTAKVEAMKIGLVVYDNTDLFTQTVVEYFEDYIGPAFNVEFIISDAIKNSNQEISFLENCSSKGATGIIGMYSASDIRIVMNKCEELGMYYVTGDPSEDKASKVGDNPYYLGGVTTSEGDYQSAYDMTTFFLEKGARKIGVPTGGASFGVKMFVERVRGIDEAVADFEAKNPDETIVVEKFDGFPSDSWFASQAQMLSSDFDAIAATFSGEFLWLQPLIDSGKADDIMLGSISAFNVVSKQAVLDGYIDYLGAVYPSVYSIHFTMLYNGMTGHGDFIRVDNQPITVSAKNVDVSSTEEMEKWVVLLDSDIPPYSVEDIKKVLKIYNEEATIEDIFVYATSEDYESVLSRRAAD